MEPEIAAHLAELGAKLPDWPPAGGVSDPPSLRTYLRRKNSQSAFWVTRDVEGPARSTHGSGIRSDEPRFVQLLAAASDALEAAVPPSPALPSGALEWPGVPRKWANLRTAAGTKPNPEGTVRPNNADWARLRAASGAAHRETERVPSARDERVYRHVARRLIGCGPAALKAGHRPRVRIRAETSLGYPFMGSDADFKRALLRMVERNGHSIVDALHSGNFATLYERFGMAAVTVVGRRYQEAEASLRAGQWVPRERTVTNWRGEVAVSKRRLGVGFDEYGVFSARSRPIMPMGFVWSLLLRVLDHFATRGLKDTRMARTFIHHGHVDIAGALDGADELHSVDATQFDSTCPEAMIRIYIDEYARAWGEAAGRLLAGTLTGCLVVNSDELDVAGFRTYGRLTQPIGSTFPGITSGTPETSRIGKWYGSSNVIIAGMNAGVVGPLEDEWDAVLEFTHPRFRMLNSGDDCIILLYGATIDPKLWKDLVPYCIYEPSPSFLGGVVVSAGTRRYVVHPDPTSRPIRAWVRGRSADDPQAGFWAVGEVYGKGSYDAHPSMRVVNATMDDVFASYYGVSWREYAVARLAGAQRPVPQFNSDADREYYINRDAIHYRVDVDEVTPALLDADHIIWEPTEYGRYLAAFVRR